MIDMIHRRGISGTRGLAAAALGAALLLSSGCSTVHWRPDLGGALRMAGERNTIVVVAYWSTFNKECWDMETQVFTHPDVETALRSTIPVRLDAWSNKKFAEEYGVRKVPTFIIFAPDGRVLRTSEGFLNEGRFRGMIEAARLSG
jgi:hypothetical protein